MGIENLFFTFLFLSIVGYTLYPLSLMIMSGIKQSLNDMRFVLGGKKIERRCLVLPDSALPAVGVIISAFNEEDCIAERIENLKSLDYPSDKIKFYIGSDGSQDKTADIVRACQDDRLVFIDFEVNRGKASVLNDLVAASDEPILVFSDANTNFKEDAIKKLVAHFHDESDVDAVCGELNLVDAQTQGNMDGAYWKFEQILKFFESRLGGLLGANGAIYAIRSSCFVPLSPDTVVDDFAVVFEISLSGGKIKYAPEATAVEEVAPTVGDEFKRRVRIGSGNYQVFFRRLSALSPHHGMLWFCYVGHKVLRWFTPHFLFLALLCSLYLSAQSQLYIVLSLIQILVYAGSFAMRNHPPGNKLLRLGVFWVNMNLALGAGFIKYCKRDVRGTWQSTDR